MQSTLSSFTEKKQGYVNHEFIKPNTILEKRYQIDIANNCITKNTAVILPTGLGKTIIAFLVMAEFIKKSKENKELKKNCKILFLAPTKPLVQQHHDSILKYMNLTEEEVCMITGNVRKNKRHALWNDKQVIVSTPQTIENDLNVGNYSMDADLIIFDEMHKSVGDYAYVAIADKSKANCRILGLTASPGNKKNKVNEIFKILKIEHIEARTRDDEDVASYIKEIDVKWLSTDLPDKILDIIKIIDDYHLDKIKKLRRLGLLNYKKPEHISKKDLLLCRDYIKRFRGRRRILAYAAYLNQSLALQSYHCLELLETQGILPFLKYFDKLKADTLSSEKPSKSAIKFTENEQLLRAIDIARTSGIEHPKINLMGETIHLQLLDKKDSLIILFTQYRSTIEIISNKLEALGIKHARFVGQASTTKNSKDKGMTQKEQKEIIEEFKKCKFNVLIATCVAEEGIDIPDVDLVLFYEPIPSEIRSIQRRGRTGRSNIGKVIILYAKDTRDQAYLYSELKKEQKMHKLVKEMRK